MKQDKKTARRIKRVRGKIVGKSLFPRLSVHRSNKHFSAQVIDDAKHHTVAAISTKQVMNGKKDKVTPVVQAQMAGEQLAKKLTELKIKQVVFDRGRFKYGGRVKAFAESVRAGNITI